MQCTKIGAFKSSYKRISCRDPQRNVISPLIFLIYVNNITTASSFHTIPYLLMISISICQTPALIFYRQLLTLNCAKLTTGWEPTSFLLTTIRLILCY